MKVSVILPVYQPKQHIKTIIKSIDTQNFSDFELIVVDDDHTDEFLLLLGELQKLVRDSDLRLIVQRTKKRGSGPAIARNIGLECASGSKITFLDCDDLWGEDFIGQMYDLLEKSGADVGVCASRVLYKKREVILRLPKCYSRAQLLQTNILSMPCVMINARKFQGKRFPIIGHDDYAFWLENVTELTKIVVEPSVLVTINKTAGSISSNFLRSAAWHWKILGQQGLYLNQKLFYFLMYVINALNKRLNFCNSIIVY